MKGSILKTAVAVALGVFSASALAEQVRVTVTIENLAPSQGTSQTPHWVGFHGGQFDLYNGGTPADFLPVPNDPRRSIEQLAEDGNTAPLSETFGELVSGGVDGTIAGPNGPIAPGDVAVATFDLNSTVAANRYFSYASMVLPSNDFWYANGNPRTHEIFDEQGNFVAKNFIVTNRDVLDAGTEVNDEVPANTAFFGQAAPNTGVDENGVILDFGDESGLVQFRQPSDGGNILATERFSMADFSLRGYPMVKISFSAEVVNSTPPPVGNPDDVTVTAGGEITIDVLANDIGTGKVLLAPNPFSLRGGNVQLVDNKLVYQPQEGFTGADNIFYVFEDSLGRSIYSQVNITVTDRENIPFPVGNADDVSVASGETITIDVLANDTGNGKTLLAPNAFSLRGGSVSLVDGQLVYTSQQGFTGSDNIFYVFEDVLGRTTYSQVNITVR